MSRKEFAVLQVICDFPQVLTGIATAAAAIAAAVDVAAAATANGFLLLHEKSGKCLCGLLTFQPFFVLVTFAVLMFSLVHI